MKSVAICLLWCGVLYAAPLFGQCVGSYVYVSPFERCMNDSAAKLAACTDSDYRCNEARVIREHDCKAAEGKRSARKLRISERARKTIWANYPEMQGAIDLINRKMGIYLTQVLGNSPYMLWSSVARVAVPPTSDL